MSSNAADRSGIQALGRVAATIGVILSLLFVGLELRQNRQLARAQVRQGLADRNAQVLSAIAENPELATAWIALWTSSGSARSIEMTATDTLQATYQMINLLRHVENVYLQYLEGVVDESVLTSYAFRNSRTFVLPQFHRFWPGVRDSFDPRFVTAFEVEYGL